MVIISEKVKLDVLDKKIILELILNSRAQLSQIAKKSRSSKEVVRYRIKKLEELGVIKSYYSEIDYFKLGWISAVLFIKINAIMQPELIKYIQLQKTMSWSCEFSGSVDIGTSIYGKSMSDIDKEIELIQMKFGKSIKKMDVFYHKTITFYPEKLFQKGIVEKKEIRTQETINLPKISLPILAELNNNPRRSSLAISQKLSIDEKTVRNNVKKLQGDGIIRKFATLFDVEKLNYLSFNVIFQNTNAEFREKLLYSLQIHPNVHYAVSFLSKDIVEAGIFVTNQYELKKIIRKIEESVEGTSLYDMFFIQKDLLSFGLPEVIFVE